MDDWKYNCTTLTKVNAADTLEYSTKGTTWNAYTTNLTITNNLTVYARETDSANNVSSQATQVITTIDRTEPTVAYSNNGGGLTGIDSTATNVNGTPTFYGGKAGTQSSGGAGGTITNPFSPSEMSNRICG